MTSLRRKTASHSTRSPSRSSMPTMPSRPATTDDAGATANRTGPSTGSLGNSRGTTTTLAAHRSSSVANAPALPPAPSTATARSRTRTRRRADTRRRACRSALAVRRVVPTSTTPVASTTTAARTRRSSSSASKCPFGAVERSHADRNVLRFGVLRQLPASGVERRRGRRPTVVSEVAEAGVDPTVPRFAPVGEQRPEAVPGQPQRCAEPGGPTPDDDRVNLLHVHRRCVPATTRLHTGGAQWAGMSRDGGNQQGARVARRRRAGRGGAPRLGVSARAPARCGQPAVAPAPRRSAASSLDPTRSTIVYCYDHECDLSARGARLLEQLGFRDVYDYAGSKTAWLGEGLPVEGEVAPEDRAVRGRRDRPRALPTRPSATSPTR